MSVRMQIYLPREQYEQLKQKSKETGKPMAEYIRESLGKYLDDLEHPGVCSDDPIWGLAGKVKSKAGDLSANHDRFLYDGEEGEST